MTEQTLRALLSAVREGKMDIDAAVQKLKAPPIEDLGFAKLDHHRALRQGFPEVVYCAGKTTEQILAIAERLIGASEENLLFSRAGEEAAQALLAAFPRLEYFPDAQMLRLMRAKQTPDGKTVAVLSAGTSDQPVAEQAAVTAETMGVEVERFYDVGVAGIHRLFEHMERIQSARVLVAVAGMEGALPSVVAGLTSRPVIAVPTSVGYGANFGGLAALLGMLNSCAGGVAVVNIDNGFGAGYIAAQICRE